MGKLFTRASELSERLAQNAIGVCRHYLPAGRREGRYWMVGDIAGTPGRSLYVRLFETERGTIGNWVDAATGEHGDLVDLIRLNQRHGRLSETIEEAERFLSLPPPASNDYDTAAAFTKPARAGSTTAAKRLFAASKLLTGSLASAYLRSRGITRVSDLPALRFHLRCYYRPNEDDAPRTPGAFPAMIAAVTDSDGAQTGAHRTWLDPSGGMKAKVASPRRAMGNILGNAVRFGQVDDVLIAGEGIETMLSLREIRLILNQIGRRLTEDFDPATKRQRVLFMLDEFPALGRLDFFESALAFMAGYGLKAFLIAQSLNQIERAYGQNNAILDNCHVRVAFATNDERTAKRVSESLGTTTEQRSMKNYAGHRLSPWLGHLMISRSETARALLTPGEILQLPKTDEVVLMSGAPPIKAKKAKYYADRRLQARVANAPASCGQRHGGAAPDDWSALPPIEPDPDLSKEHRRKLDSANGGLRREPELPEHVEVVARPKALTAEFEFSDADSADVDQAAANERIRRTMERSARQASLDLGDGIEL